MRICIVGAGIGGCAAALLLAQQGHDVRVFEAVPELSPLGVGINLLPHAVQVLERLGLADRLQSLGVPTQELAYYNRHGQRIWSEPRGKFAGYPVPQVSIHRGTLQMELFHEARKQLGEDRIVTGHRFIGCEGERPVTARFETESGEIVAVEADMLIGADGIHSTLRKMRYPDEGLPVYGGRILWRATSRAKPYLTGATMIMAGYQDRKFVAYPISPIGEDGMQTINWIAELTVNEMPGREDWNKEIDRAVFADKFADWTFDWLDVPGLIATADCVYEFPLIDRNPLPAWSFGATTLLGDAAHPMYPIGSNGASQAILDIEALIKILDSESDPVAALKAYEAERLPATAAIVLANRGNGPEQCMQMAEERAPQGFASIGDVFAEGELEAIAARYKAVAGFSKEAVAKLEKQSA
ncbi:MAG TPA: flavin-dependent oxidoreductase [Chakrabartia sp.]|jgi:2-polyprenyl-6-methoxyphenol hydroxylase-like FAD-dependent oxidoreductase|nr:flavin-dependent oxidoreductase [Chakrabartia sp.]